MRATTRRRALRPDVLATRSGRSITKSTVSDVLSCSFAVHEYEHEYEYEDVHEYAYEYDNVSRSAKLAKVTTALRRELSSGGNRRPNPRHPVRAMLIDGG